MAASQGYKLAAHSDIFLMSSVRDIFCLYFILYSHNKIVFFSKQRFPDFVLKHVTGDSSVDKIWI